MSRRPLIASGSASSPSMLRTLPTKATRATDAGRSKGYPLTTEPEE
jgi:hypothetical protein